LFYFEKDGVLAHLIHLFKYNRVKEIGSFLGAWLGDHLKESTVKE
jgi:predicted amidophosphoribosyltransferase